MRIYNADGSVKRDDLNDEFFGCALPSTGGDTNEDADENVPIDRNPTESDGDAYMEEIHVNEVHGGYNPTRYKNARKNYHHKEELTTFLLQKGDVESLLLLSIVNNAVYKDMCEAKLHKNIRIDDAKISNIENTSKSRRQRLKNLECTFRGITDDAANAPADKSRSFGSITPDEGTDKNGTSEVSTDATNAEDSPDVFIGDAETCDEAVSDCSKGCEIFRSGIGSDAIDKTLRNFFERTCELHREVGEIGKCFLDYDERLTNFKTKHLNLREEIKQRKYMDDLMLLLDGKVEEVKWKWPFKIGKAEGNEFTNLIV